MSFSLSSLSLKKKNGRRKRRKKKETNPAAENVTYNKFAGSPGPRPGHFMDHGQAVMTKSGIKQIQNDALLGSQVSLLAVTFELFVRGGF